jgi:hypothetical protein
VFGDAIVPSALATLLPLAALDAAMSCARTPPAAPHTNNPSHSHFFIKLPASAHTALQTVNLSTIAEHLCPHSFFALSVPSQIPQPIL